MVEEFKKTLSYICYKINIEINEEQLWKFYQFYQLLLEWNQRMNLTAIIEERDVIYKHFADSIAVLKYIDMKEEDNVIDVGCGAGFPGIPLKIMRPGIRITLVDSVNKKLDFVREAATVLELSDVSCIHGRAEDLGREKGLRNSFDFCVSRAVSELAVLSELCLPFIKKQSLFISYKGGSPEEELKEAEYAIKELGGKIETVEKFVLPETDMERSFIMIRSVKQISDKYPRKVGVPKKSPLMRQL